MSKGLDYIDERRKTEEEECLKGNNLLQLAELLENSMQYNHKISEWPQIKPLLRLMIKLINQYERTDYNTPREYWLDIADKNLKNNADRLGGYTVRNLLASSIESNTRYVKEMHHVQILEQRVQQLVDGINKFLDAKGNDLCHENRKELGELVGRTNVDCSTIPEEEFLKNCKEYAEEIYGKS